jgi:hypothetical protein
MCEKKKNGVLSFEWKKKSINQCVSFSFSFVFFLSEYCQLPLPLPHCHCHTVTCWQWHNISIAATLPHCHTATVNTGSVAVWQWQWLGGRKKKSANLTPPHFFTIKNVRKIAKIIRSGPVFSPKMAESGNFWRNFRRNRLPDPTYIWKMRRFWAFLSVFFVFLSVFSQKNGFYMKNGLKMPPKYEFFISKINENDLKIAFKRLITNFAHISQVKNGILSLYPTK